MTTLTIDVDDELLRIARAKAAAQGTSVEEICSMAIEHFAAPEVHRRRRALRLLQLADTVAAGTGPQWPGRDRLFEA